MSDDARGGHLNDAQADKFLEFLQAQTTLLQFAPPMWNVWAWPWFLLEIKKISCHPDVPKWWQFWKWLEFRNKHCVRFVKMKPSKDRTSKISFKPGG